VRVLFNLCVRTHTSGNRRVFQSSCGSIIEIGDSLSAALPLTVSSFTISIQAWYLVGWSGKITGCNRARRIVCWLAYVTALIVNVYVSSGLSFSSHFLSHSSTLERDLAPCPSVRLSVCLSHAGIDSKLMIVGSRHFHHLVVQIVHKFAGSRLQCQISRKWYKIELYLQWWTGRKS